MPVPPVNNASALRTSWQDQLKTYCKYHRLPEPIFQEISDRRGGRTAWSCTATIQGHTHAARFWYDAAHSHNAKEDVAEVALKRLCSQNAPW